MNIQQLADHISISSLPQRLGGIADISHTVWVSKCLQSLWHKSSIDDDDIVTYVAPIIARPSLADATRLSVSSASPSDAAVWDTEALNSALNCGFDLGWDEPPTSSSIDLTSPLWLSSRKRSVDSSPVAGQETTGNCSTPAAVILLSPPPPKRRFSESIHGPDPSGGRTINELVQYILEKGRHGLVKEYKLLKEKDTTGTFEASKYDFNMTSVCEICCIVCCLLKCHICVELMLMIGCNAFLFLGRFAACVTGSFSVSSGYLC